MRVGICGYPGSGKSTVFSALAPGANPGRGVVFGNIKVPDERVDRLAAIFSPKKTTYAEITFVDFGNTGGAGGGAFPPEVVQSMRNADALVHVVRVFDNPMLGEDPNPDGDVSRFHDELLLLDLGVMEKRLDRFQREHRKGMDVDATARCVEHLENGGALRSLELSEGEWETLNDVQLISAKPLLTLYNLSEDNMSDPECARFKEAKAPTNNEVSLAVCGSIEEEIASLDPEDQQEFLEAMDLSEPARNPFIRAAYGLLDLISFLTAGPDECRAWPIRRGIVARKAAGKVHSDIERGFIRAEVYRLDDLEAAGSEAALKQKGQIRVEGKDYVMQDGDVTNYRFNV